MKKCLGYVLCDKCGENMECKSKGECPRQYEENMMKSAEQIIADIQEREKFHLSEKEMLAERCQILADLHDKATRELNEFKAHIQSCLLEFVTLAKRGIIRDRLIVNLYEKEVGDGAAAPEIEMK